MPVAASRRMNRLEKSVTEAGWHGNACACPVPPLHFIDITMADFPSASSSAQRGNAPAGQGWHPPASQASAGASRETVHLLARAQAPQRLLDGTATSWINPDEQPGQDNQEAVRQAICALGDSLSDWNRRGEIDLGEATSLFRQVKETCGAGYLKLQCHETALAGMISQLTVFLRRFSCAVQERRVGLESWHIADVHHACNGLSACFGASQDDCLLRPEQLERLREPLTALNQALIARAMQCGLPRQIKSNGMLMDILNCQTRGLRQALFDFRDEKIAALFRASLKVMFEWLAPHGDGAPMTLLGPLDTRQLGKCMVQLKTMYKYGLIDLDAATPDGRNNRSLLEEVTLGLCGGLSGGFTTWRQAGNDGSSSIRGTHWQLMPAAVERVPVTNIGNTIKDFIAVGLISTCAPQLPAIVGQLSEWMQHIPTRELVDAGHRAQGLGNCCNFLRGMSEALFSGMTLPVQERNRFSRACARMLTLAEQFVGKPHLVSMDQSLVNLVSFIKAMNKLGEQSRSQLERLAGSLLQVLNSLAEAIHHIDSITGLLAGLAYLLRSKLAGSGQMAGLLGTLIRHARSSNIGNCAPEARMHLADGALLCLAISQKSDARQHCATLLDTLLRLYRQGEERLPYLKAARHLLATGEGQAQRLQPVLRRLLGRQASEITGLSELEEAIGRLQAAPDIQIKGAPDDPAPELFPPDPASESQKAHWRPGPTYRAPMPATTTTTTTATTTGFCSPTTTTTTTTTTTAPPADHRHHQQLIQNDVAQRRDVPASMAVTPTIVPAWGTKTNAATNASLPSSRKPGKPDRGVARPRPSSNTTSKPLPGNRKWKSDVEEWFALLAQPDKETEERLARLKELAKANRTLLQASMGEGKGTSGALYRALATGKPKTVDWLTREIPADTQPAPEAVLEQLFGDLDVLIGSNHKTALEAYLDSLPRQGRDRVTAHFTARLIVIPKGFQQVMKERGLQFSGAVERTLGPVRKNKRHQKVTPSPGLDNFANPFSLDKRSNILISSVMLGLSSQVSDLLSKPAGQAMAVEQDASGRNALMYASLCSPLLRALSFRGPDQFLQPDRRPEAAATPVSKQSRPLTKLLDIKFTNQLLALPSAQVQARAIDHDGNNALMYAITSDCFVNARQLLLLSSADEQAGIRDKEDRNAMMLAVMHGQLTVFEWLLELPSGKAQLQAVDGKGRNAIDYIRQHLDGEERERLLAMADAVLNPRTE